MPSDVRFQGQNAQKFDFCWGTYSAPPDTLAVFKGPTSKGVRKEGNGKMEGVGGEGKGRKRKEHGK